MVVGVSVVVMDVLITVGMVVAEVVFMGVVVGSGGNGGGALLEINKRNFPLQFYFPASDEAAPFM